MMIIRCFIDQSSKHATNFMTFLQSLLEKLFRIAKRTVPKRSGNQGFSKKLHGPHYILDTSCNLYSNRFDCLTRPVQVSGQLGSLHIADLMKEGDKNERHSPGLSIGPQL